VTERAWQQTVVELAQLLGWRVCFTHDSRRSPAGWPDLVLCRPPELIVVELKSARGSVRPEQRAWLEALVLRPRHFDAVHERLRRWPSATEAT
jgi:hypothetical protein